MEKRGCNVDLNTTITTILIDHHNYPASDCKDRTEGNKTFCNLYKLAEYLYACIYKNICIL